MRTSSTLYFNQRAPTNISIYIHVPGGPEASHYFVPPVQTFWFSRVFFVACLSFLSFRQLLSFSRSFSAFFFGSSIPQIMKIRPKHCRVVQNQRFAKCVLFYIWVAFWSLLAPLGPFFWDCLRHRGSLGRALATKCHSRFGKFEVSVRIGAPMAPVDAKRSAGTPKRTTK